MPRRPVYSSETSALRKSISLDIFLDAEPDISLSRLKKRRLERMPVTGAFSTDRIIDILMDASAYWTKEDAEKGMYSFLRSVVKNGATSCGWAPLVMYGTIQGY